MGICKAYTTRVGEGPFPTELENEIGDELAKVGHEFGSTTGRPRRCGWFDGVVAKYAVMVNGVDTWTITKLDVLDGFESIELCTGYECDGVTYTSVPADTTILARCTPIYETWKGWNTPTTGIRNYDDLPAEAKAYLDRIEEVTGAKVGIVSVGPDRDDTLIREESGVLQGV